MPYISLQYHRQVPAPGPIFPWQGIGPARTWRSAATDYYRTTTTTTTILRPLNCIREYCGELVPERYDQEEL